MTGFVAQGHMLLVENMPLMPLKINYKWQPEQVKWVASMSLIVSMGLPSFWKIFWFCVFMIIYLIKTVILLNIIAI